MQHDGPLRVLVVGHAFAGKSSLIRSICRGDAAATRSSLQRTVGCHADCSTHVYRGRTYDVEWLEVGAMEQHQSGRSVYYRHVDGVVAVFDATSERSFARAPEWLAELADVMAERELRRRAGGDGSRRAAAAAQIAAEEEGRAAPGSSGSAGGRRRPPPAGGGGGGGGSGGGGGGDGGAWAATGGGAPGLLSPHAPPLLQPAGGTGGGGGGDAAEGGSDAAARSQLSAELLRRTPMLLVANKCDLLQSSAALTRQRQQAAAGRRRAAAGARGGWLGGWEAWCSRCASALGCGGGGGGGGVPPPTHRYLAAIDRRASRVKLDVPRPLLGGDAGGGGDGGSGGGGGGGGAATVVCGLACRARGGRRGATSLELPVAHAAAGADELPRDVLDAFLDDVAAAAMAAAEGITEGVHR